MRTHETATKDPVTRGRRAGIERLQPPHFISRVRDNMRPPLPAHALLRGAKRPYFEPERAEFIFAREGGDKFSGGFGEVVGREGESGAVEKAISPNF